MMSAPASMMPEHAHLTTPRTTYHMVPMVQFALYDGFVKKYVVLDAATKGISRNFDAAMRIRPRGTVGIRFFDVCVTETWFGTTAVHTEGYTANTSGTHFIEAD